MASVTSPRVYRSDLREQQAQRTQELIAAAARARFVDKGWAGTTVRSVAELAGVSEATVYHVYGSKAGLASSLIDAAEHSADVRQTVSELQERVGDPAGQLRAFVDFDRRFYERAGDVIQILAEGRRQHPDLATAYEEGRNRGDSERRKVFSSWPVEVWRPAGGLEQAVAVYGVLVSLGSFDTAIREYGWSPADVENWWYTTLVELLLR